MQTKVIPRVFAVLIAFAVSAPAQFDAGKFATDLRAKYGPPVARAVFTIPAGEMVVDYATSGHVCRIQLPGIGPEEAGSRVRSPKGMNDFLLRLLPLSMRGKHLGKMFTALGAPSALTTQYENVRVSEMFQDKRRIGLTVTFTNEKCGD